MTTHEPPENDPQTESEALNAGGDTGVKMATARAAAKLAREKRRQVIATLVTYHWTYQEIADRVGVAVGTVCSDVAVIRKRWQERYAEEYARHVAEEIAKLDDLERRILPLALTGGARSGEEGAKPSLWAVDRALAIMDRRARLLGLDKPTKVDAKVTVTESTVLDDQIRALLEQMQHREEVPGVVPADPG